MTETTAVATMSNIGRADLGRPAEERHAIVARQGKVVSGIEIKVVDESGRTLPRDGVSQGELMVRGHWIVENAKANKLNMDIAKVPSKESDTTVIGFGGYAVNKTTANADLAKALILELTSEETQKEEGEGGGGVPGRKSAASTEAFLSFPPSAALYYETLPHTKAVPSPANFQEVEKIFIRYYTAMMSGETSIADGVKQADAELNDSFARLKQQMGG